MAVITTEHKFKITRLPSEIKQKWIEALRSGKYVQGSSMLVNVSYKFNNPTTHCCLGVLGAVCGIEERELEGQDFLEGFLPGIPEEIIEFVHNNSLQSMLADNNDGNIVKETGSEEIGKARVAYKRATFEELADWIEENL